MEKKKENVTKKQVEPKKSIKKKSIKNKTTTSKVVTTKKNIKKKKKKNKAFTLIELLAVIIILGVLMIIAIPSVTTYISNSRKNAYIDTAKNIVGGARNLVNTGKFGMYDTSVTYYISVNRIPSENGTRSPYGDFTEAYIGVIYNGKSYEYFWISNDTAREGIPVVTSIDKLENESIQSDVNDIDIRTTVETTGVKGRCTIMILKDGDTWNGPLSANNCNGENGNSGSSGNTVSVPVSFATDSWATIDNAIKSNNTDAYNIGDTREVDLGELGVHTLRIANKSTPSECNNSDFSQTACGFVLEFADIIVNQKMNDERINTGGWCSSKLRLYVNNDFYNSLPTELKSMIINTKVKSGYNVGDDDYFCETNDKIYLFSSKEVYGVIPIYGRAPYTVQYGVVEETRQLDYYNFLGINQYNYSNTIKNYNGTERQWWLRSTSKRISFPENNYYFSVVGTNGIYGGDFADSNSGLSPAFRIG